MERVLCSKLGEDQKEKKKVLTQKWSDFCVQNYVKAKKKGLLPELKRFLCPKSLLSVLLL